MQLVGWRDVLAGSADVKRNSLQNSTRPVQTPQANTNSYWKSGVDDKGNEIQLGNASEGLSLSTHMK